MIDLARDGWIATAETDPAIACHVAEGWWQTPYPLFKRLALFAAAHNDVISNRQALEWLFLNNCWWLWSVETEREALRLLVALAPRLENSELAQLEQAILAGPPREMFQVVIEHSEWIQILDREVWLRLAKMQVAGAELSDEASAKLMSLMMQHSDWQLADDDRDEFPFRMCSVDELHNFTPTPRRRVELIKWLRENPSSGYRKEDDWRQRCRDEFPTTAYTLCKLAKEGDWPIDRWRSALLEWSKDDLVVRSWRYMGPVLNDSPDEVLRALGHGLSYWVKAIAKTFEGNEALFVNICRRILESDQTDGVDTSEPVTRAINHPVGHVTEALLDWWYRKREEGQGLPEEIKSIFTELSNTDIDKFRHGRVLLATHIIALYRVEQEWADENILPLFDWQRSPIEARSAWEGFLWSPRLYNPLLAALKGPLLNTVEHYEELGKHAKQYADFLTFAALNRGDIFTTEELADATMQLPIDGLNSAAKALSRALEGAGEQREEYWENRLLPYLRKIWPKQRDLATPALSESVARLCVTAREAFPKAILELQHWLQPIQHPGYLLGLIEKTKLCEKYPTEVLDFIDRIVGDDARLLSDQFRKCLSDISKADPQLISSPSFIRLSDLVRRHSMT